MSARPPANKVKKLQTENSKLKAEVMRLKSQAPKANSKKRTKSSGLNIARKTAIILLVSFAVALLTVANVLFWFGNTVVKQDRFVAATQPIIKDPVVQSTMALYATNQIFNNVDVQGFTEGVLPPRADFLAPQLTTQLKTFTQSTLQKTLASPALQDKWNTTLSKQHQRLISFASKYQGDGDISINDVYNQLDSKLANTKLSFLADKQLPSKVGDVTVISAPWLPAFHNVVVNIDTWRLIAVILLVVSVAGAVWLSRYRRRTLYIFSLATASFMLVTLISLRVMRETIISKVDPQYTDGVRHVLRIVFHSLVLQTVTILVTALLIWFIAWISGPSRRATAVKKQISLLFSGKMHESIFAQENKYTAWVQKNKRLLQWSVVGVVALVMLLVRITLLGLLLYALLMLFLVLAIEVIGGSPAKPHARTTKKA